MKSKAVSTVVNENQGLSVEQERVIELLLAGQSQAAAAREVGIAAETVSRWMSGDAVFVATLNRQRFELWQRSKARLWQLTETALNTVEDIMTSPGVSDAVKLRAALAVLGACEKAPGGATEPADVRSGWAMVEMLRFP
jgi:hypothetical protein